MTVIRAAIAELIGMFIDDGVAPGGAVLERIYERHRERIQEVADRKHRKRQLEKDGTIIVHRADLTN